MSEPWTPERVVKAVLRDPKLIVDMWQANGQIRTHNQQLTKQLKQTYTELGMAHMIIYYLIEKQGGEIRLDEKFLTTIDLKKASVNREDDKSKGEIILRTYLRENASKEESAPTKKES
jgi:hypothetical protein